ncbi:uncharacterized protein STEHIDRAFT_169209 [Stereum hirsutum FP-91666 SS1]|uniref:uncharacterized protein n=1 Tax=Stereum hirsutum (strain FP-91666) TaxID=721885 RepID=UPI000444960A|nr:uncharacterized protein STEHIDRAFT_169209 [Stereum hirsutum FP-91666 SS1]EIM86295.1 hypothetical protein STEHIDRAFT_169209 [Stereum hirsutum FP-91666 SS1]
MLGAVDDASRLGAHRRHRRRALHVVLLVLPDHHHLHYRIVVPFARSLFSSSFVLLSAPSLGDFPSMVASVTPPSSPPPSVVISKRDRNRVRRSACQCKRAHLGSLEKGEEGALEGWCGPQVESSGFGTRYL